MSADLLAEFDSFYQAPSKSQTNTIPAANDLAFLGDTSQIGHPTQGGSQCQTAAEANRGADIWGDMTSFAPSANVQSRNTSQDDEWGSFEGFGEPVQAPQQSAFQSFTPAAANYGGSREDTPRTGIVRRPTTDIFNSKTYTAAPYPGIPQSISEFVPQKHAPLPKSPQSDILFDAADELSPNAEDDDDFGDFETVTTPDPPLPPPASQSLDKLFGFTSLDSRKSDLGKAQKKPHDLAPTSLDSPLPYPQAPKSPSFQERNPFGALGLAMNQVSAVKQSGKPTSASPVTAWPTFVTPVLKADAYADLPVPAPQEDEDWGDFADMPPDVSAVKGTKSTGPVKSRRPSTGIETDAWGWDEADNVSSHEVQNSSDGPPPTNVPPPSVLLTLFPPLFDIPQDTLFKYVVNQPFSLKNRILSDPTTVKFLRSYILIATVAARIIAGRKLRWKRDTILSQSMKIGQATRGGKGGMKLTGVDKAEATREDREAAEVVRIWKEQVGRLKSTIAVANTSIKNTGEHLQIPDITETMHVRVEASGVTAPKPCVICGLKRDERIVKVDIQVEDSFGEWWADHWGHRACKNLWEEHQSKLKHS